MQDRGTRKDVLAASAVEVLDDAGTVTAQLRNVTIRNISPGGASLEVPVALQETAILPRTGQHIRLASALLASPAVDARVVWDHLGVETLVLGIKFHLLSEEDHAAVTGYVQDRRHALRQIADFQAWLVLPGEKDWSAVIENISVTGALITMDPDEVDASRLTPGVRALFRFQYMFIEMMECQGIVAWVHQDRDELQLGLHFEDLKDSDLKLIQRFVG